MTKQNDDQKPKSSIKVHFIEREVVPDDKLMLTMRKEPPSHYVLEIESFSVLSRLLSETGLDRYESPEFEADGHQWRLILHLKEDDQRNGGDHISLYLEIMGTQYLSHISEINALLKFFVFDYKKNQYISIQDGRVKRFSAVKKKWGFSRLLPDTLKGHQLKSTEGDSCKFGVEVFVLKSDQGKGECFSILDNPSKKHFFSWKIEKFNSKTLKEVKQLCSQEFTTGDYKWKLNLYPKGVPKVKDQFLSIFLHLQFPQKFSKMHVEFKIRMILLDRLEEKNSKITEKTGNAWFSTLASFWGFPYFIKLADLTEEEVLKVNDDAVFEAEICSISITKDLYSDPQKATKDASKDDTRPAIDRMPF